jgi:hypothetical protein
MTTTRRFTCSDLFQFNNINLDSLTETVSYSFFPAPVSFCLRLFNFLINTSLTCNFIYSTWQHGQRCALLHTTVLEDQWDTVLDSSFTESFICNTPIVTVMTLTSTTSLLFNFIYTCISLSPPFPITITLTSILAQCSNTVQCSVKQKEQEQIGMDTSLL